MGLLLVVLAVILYLPFYLGLRSQAAPPYLLPFIMRPTRLAHFLVIFGMPLVGVTFLTAILAGFGRAVAEVGAVIIVGGNIAHLTRVMTTAIALETNRGDLPLALGLGVLLIGLSILINAAAHLAQEVTRSAAT